MLAHPYQFSYYDAVAHPADVQGLHLFQDLEFTQSIVQSHLEAVPQALKSNGTATSASAQVQTLQLFLLGQMLVNQCLEPVAELNGDASPHWFPTVWNYQGGSP